MTDAEHQVALFLPMLRNRFDRFVESAFKTLYPKDLFSSEPYVQALCFALQGVVKETERRLLITMPPRHLKSFCAAVALPAYALGRDPTLKITVASYSKELSRDHAELFRRLITSPLYQRVFPVFQLAERGDRIEHFQTTQGGGRRAVSVGGTFTGIGVDLLILDDLIKANDVHSAASRDEVERFYTDTALTRFNNPRKSRIISVQQRLHLEDIVARLIATGRYRHFNLPIIADRDLELPLYEGDAWKWREGDLLSPQRFPQEEIDRFRAEMGSASFAAQYLLDPQLAGGQMANWSRVQVADDAFDGDDIIYKVQSIDTAVKAGDECDYSVITTWGYNGEKWQLLDIFRARLEYPDLKSIAIAHAERWRADKVFVEDANLGSALCRELREAGRDAICIRPRDGKAERFSQALDLLYDGNIELCSSVDGFDELRHEVRGFPSARHDDIVDSISQFALWARNTWMEAAIAKRDGRRAPSRPRRSNPARRLAGL